MNKIIFENDAGIYTIECRKKNCVHISDVIDYLIRPVLAAAGYREEILDKRIPYDEDFI